MHTKDRGVIVVLLIELNRELRRIKVEKKTVDHLILRTKGLNSQESRLLEQERKIDFKKKQYFWKIILLRVTFT